MKKVFLICQRGVTIEPSRVLKAINDVADAETVVTVFRSNDMEKTIADSLTVPTITTQEDTSQWDEAQWLSKIAKVVRESDYVIIVQGNHSGIGTGVARQVAYSSEIANRTLFA